MALFFPFQTGADGVRVADGLCDAFGQQRPQAAASSARATKGVPSAGAFAALRFGCAPFGGSTLFSPHAAHVLAVSGFSFPQFLQIHIS